MKPVLLSLSLLAFACNQQESEESKQLKEQNALLKKQVEKLESKPAAPAPVNYANQVTGTYIGYELEDYVNGKTIQLPSNGVSAIRKIDAMGKKKILIYIEDTGRGLLGAKKQVSGTYTANLTPGEDFLEFKEIWEKGEGEAYGTVDEHEFVEYTVRRSDGKLLSKLRAKK